MLSLDIYLLSKNSYISNYCRNLSSFTDNDRFQTVTIKGDLVCQSSAAIGNNWYRFGLALAEVNGSNGLVKIWQRSVKHCPSLYVTVWCTVYPKKYAHGFVVLCFVVVMQSFIMNSHEVFIHIHQGCFASTGAIVRLPQCQWSRPDGYGEIS